MSARPIVLAGIVAGVVSTLVQIILWMLFTSLPGMLFRDARYAAATVLGRSVLQPSAVFDAQVMFIATLVHFTLSITFAAALAAFVGRRTMLQALAVGAVFGGALYAVNLHVMTFIFPWFAVSRGAITLAAHLAFGISAAAVLVETRRGP